MLLPGTISPKCSKAEGHLGEVLAQDSAGLGFRATIDVEAPRFSIIVAVYNRAAELQKCLEALQNVLEHGELIVVDDNSLENVRDVVAEYNARYFRTSRRAGPAAARNLGARHALGDILIFVDADVVVPADAIDIVRREFENNPELAALFGSYDDDPACTNFWSLFKNLLHHYVHQVSSPNASTFWAGCGAIRKPSFDAIGGFDAVRYPAPSVEDIELGVRLARQRRSIRLVKRLQVKHLKKWTFRSMTRSDIFHRAIPWTRLILRTRSLPGNLNLTSTSRTSAGLVAVAVLLAGGMSVGALRALDWLARDFAAGFALSAVTLLYLNQNLYRFFWRKRGATFAIRAALAHWMYLFYSGSVFVIYSAAELLRTRFRSPATDLILEHLHRNAD